MSKNPKCAVCGEEVNRAETEVYYNSGKYIHLGCIDAYKEAHPRATKFDLLDKVSVNKNYVDYTYDYLNKEIGMKCEYSVLRQQWNFFRKKYKNYTDVGIFNTVKYMYGVQKLSIEKSQNRIGLVPYKYEEAQEYFKNVESQKERIKASMDSQMNKTPIVLNIPKPVIKDKRKFYDLDAVEEENEC